MSTKKSFMQAVKAYERREKRNGYSLMEMAVAIFQIADELAKTAEEDGLTDKTFYHLRAYCNALGDPKYDLDVDNITRIFLYMLKEDKAETLHMLNNDVGELIDVTVNDYAPIVYPEAYVDKGEDKSLVWGDGELTEDKLTEARRASWDVSYTDLMPFIKTEMTPDGLISITTDLQTMGKKVLHTRLLGRKSEKTGNTIGFDVRKAARVAIREVISQVQNSESPDTKLDQVVKSVMDRTPEFGGWDPKFHEKAKRSAELYASRGYQSMIETDLQEIVTSDAYMKAIIAAFFKDGLEQYKAKKKDKVFRALDMNNAEREAVKNWFAQHITNMQFRFPQNDDNSYCGVLSIPETNMEARDASSKKVEDRWEKGFNAFTYLCPNAVEGRDYKLRLTSSEKDIHKYLWNPSCTITIDEPFSKAPEAAKEMLARVKSRKDAKDYEDAVTDNVISSYWLGIAILELFNGDLTFYTKRRRGQKDSEGSDFSDSLIDEYTD